ncbi:MAG: lipopolysaccharide heptosyltransferase I [Gammaproteobacteria bacterium]|nr:lipopolysaccharide heptosyltransferase I [Gammaproteobacteria bacterium]
MKALLVKTSSLGDVTHALPAVTAAGRHGVRFDWVVEEAYQAIPERHPGVERVIPIAWRRWRRNPVYSRREAAAFSADLRTREYDLVLDAQGLMKSALVAALARGGERVGFARGDVREAVAAWFYQRGVAVPRRQHAIDRQRQLFAGAFGYAQDAAEPIEFGLSRRESAGSAGHFACRSTCLFLHGGSWPSKQWPQALWVELARQAQADGFEVLLPWGNPAERCRAQHIAAQGGGRTLPAMGIDEWIDLLQEVRLAVGVDSGLAHLAAACGAPTLALYGSTTPNLTGARGPRAATLASTFPCAPCLSRACRYRGPGRVRHDEPVSPPCYAELTPGRVWARAMALLDAEA